MKRLDEQLEDRIVRHYPKEKDRMALTVKKPKPEAEAIDPDGLYRPLDSFTCELDGDTHVVTLSSRLRGSHPVVTAHPDWFVLEGLSDQEFAQARARMRVGG